MKRRPLRIAGLIHRLLASALQREVAEPDAWKINITRVTITPDLRWARVYYTSVGGDADKPALENILKGSKSALKRAMAKNLRIRFQPELEFIWDEDMVRVEKVEGILDRLKIPAKEVDPPAEETVEQTND